MEEKIKSGKCRHEIKNIGKISGDTYITKYVLDLSVSPVITEIRIYPDEKGHFSIPAEYRSDVTYGSNVKSLAVSLYSEGVMSNDRIAAFLNAACSDELGLSEGNVYGFCKKFTVNAGMSIHHLENELLNQNVVATDATTVTVNSEQNYIRNFSTQNTVVYNAMKSKSIKALGEIPFLAAYSGILVHDHETALYHYGTDHAECNVHILRYLRKNTEDTGNKWSGKVAALLCEMNNARKELISQGIKEFSDETIREYAQRYDAIILSGREENKKQSINTQSTMNLHCLTDWRSTVTTIFFSCITLRSCLMIIFRNVTLGKPKTVRRWQADSVRTADMKCTAGF